jgi:Spy/CpxP family protein refolding chaperone
MQWLIGRSNLIWSLLFSSMAFNAGFGTTFAVRTYRGMCRDAQTGACAPRLDEQLNLTPEQKALMAAARERLLRQVADLRRELDTQREALATLLQVADPDRAEIAQQLEQTAALQQQIQQRVVEHLLEKRELLDREQREVFNEIIRHRVHPCGGPGAKRATEDAGTPDAAREPGPGRCRGMGGP